MQPCDEDITEIEMKSDGSWRAKIGRPFKDLERWHLPDGSLTISEVKVDSGMEVAAKTPDAQLDICANGNRNGFGILDVSRNPLDEYYTSSAQEIISMSSGSSENKDSMMDFTPYNHNRSSSSSLGDPSVIILSDSEEENDDAVSPRGVSMPETRVTQSGDAAFQAASSRPTGNDVKAEPSQMSNGKGLGGPFTFPRQPRTARRHNSARDVQDA